MCLQLLVVSDYRYSSWTVGWVVTVGLDGPDLIRQYYYE